MSKVMEWCENRYAYLGGGSMWVSIIVRCILLVAAMFTISFWSYPIALFFHTASELLPAIHPGLPFAQVRFGTEGFCLGMLICWWLMSFPKEED